MPASTRSLPVIPPDGGRDRNSRPTRQRQEGHRGSNTNRSPLPPLRPRLPPLRGTRPPQRHLPPLRPDAHRRLDGRPAPRGRPRRHRATPPRAGAAQSRNLPGNLAVRLTRSCATTSRQPAGQGPGRGPGHARRSSKSCITTSRPGSYSIRPSPRPSLAAAGSRERSTRSPGAARTSTWRPRETSRPRTERSVALSAAPSEVPMATPNPTHHRDRLPARRRSQPDQGTEMSTAPAPTMS
jgi:hypothetical protein